MFKGRGKKNGKVFGVPLAEVVCMNRTQDANSPIPSLCSDVVAYLEKHGLSSSFFLFSSSLSVRSLGVGGLGRVLCAGGDLQSAGSSVAFGSAQGEL